MLKLGGNVDCWCGKCNMILAHTIEAMVKDKPARVHCNTCKAQHTYKPNKPGETSRRPRTGEEGAPRSPKSRCSSRTARRCWYMEGDPPGRRGDRVFSSGFIRSLIRHPQYRRQPRGLAWRLR